MEVVVMKVTLAETISCCCAVLVAIIISGCENFSPVNEIAPVSNFNITRYMGTWYEIARLPHNFEAGVTDAQATYTLQDDGTIIIENSGKKNQITTSAHATARSAIPGSGLGLLEVSFFYPFYTMYKIIYLDPNYSLAIVTGNSMDYLWILARKPVISKEKLAMCLKMLENWGYAVKLLQYPTGEITGILNNQSE